MNVYVLYLERRKQALKDNLIIHGVYRNYDDAFKDYECMKDPNFYPGIERAKLR